MDTPAPRSDDLGDETELCSCEEAVALRARVAELGQAAAELAMANMGGVSLGVQLTLLDQVRKVVAIWEDACRRGRDDTGNARMTDISDLLRGAR